MAAGGWAAASPSSQPFHQLLSQVRGAEVNLDIDPTLGLSRRRHLQLLEERFGIQILSLCHEDYSGPPAKSGNH